MSEPKALLNMLPHEKMAIRKPSSLRLYHFERMNTAPCHSMRTRENMRETFTSDNLPEKTRCHKHPRRNASKERRKSRG